MKQIIIRKLVALGLMIALGSAFTLTAMEKITLSPALMQKTMPNGFTIAEIFQTSDIRTIASSLELLGQVHIQLHRGPIVNLLAIFCDKKMSALSAEYLALIEDFETIQKSSNTAAAQQFKERFEPFANLFELLKPNFIQYRTVQGWEIQAIDFFIRDVRTFLNQNNTTQPPRTTTAPPTATTTTTRPTMTPPSYHADETKEDNRI
ncbi:MAG: hypothetical protein UU47_C0002G0021 [candidate division TM6 bacterium GW2011_GWE2_41_16]|nr:MAG: hypothetical protein UU47_C0002G0021 [candidate division TM6 bacterium GW2011_GWE2_41_16]